MTTEHDTTGKRVLRWPAAAGAPVAEMAEWADTAVTAAARWRTHGPAGLTTPGDLATTLEHVRRLRDALDAVERAAVEAARAEDPPALSWGEIGDALGVHRTSAAERYNQRGRPPAWEWLAADTTAAED